jgi:hypothetical protein
MKLLLSTLPEPLKLTSSPDPPGALYRKCEFVTVNAPLLLSVTPVLLTKVLVA